MRRNFSIKRIVSLLIAVLMVVSIMPAAFAEEAALENETFMTPEQAQAINLPAFPGAEGGGKYTTGGRGGEVYRVTNLNDDGEGSLRDAVSKPNRTIVFDVSGTIHLKSALKLDQPNITIAGQTAPGDGICVGDYNIVIAADNVIIRYMRFRPGDISHAENDAVFARYQKDIILDHCSTSWSTDETMSLYGVANTTVQWCMISESLALAVHAKGRHGYGGIWGGANVTYHHNLVATHTSRLPRYSSLSSTHPDFGGISDNDMVNNVIYNWGFNNAYGAEEATVNVINNYYKTGPITNADVKNRIWNPSKAGVFYFSGNVLEGNSEVTNDNLKGVILNEGAEAPNYVDEPVYDSLIPMDNIDTAQEAYEKILVDAGATVPRRDSYDARVINDTKNGTGRAVNNESEVGGWPTLNSAEAPLDSDGDGMPDSYEEKNGLNKSDPADGKIIADNGYTNLENYLNGIVESAAEPQNPEVTLNIKNNTCYNYGEPIELKAEAKAADGRSISKVEFYKNDEMVGTAESSPYTFTLSNAEEGIAYMSARAVDSAGEATTSEIKVININYTDSVSPWLTADIGESTMDGSYSYRDGVYTVKSSGLIGPGNDFNIALGDPTTDSFSYMYQPVDENAVLSTQIASVSRLNNNCASGLMIRDELTEKSDFVMVNYEIEKGGSGIAFKYRQDGKYNREFLKLEVLPRYLKLVKEGSTVSAYHSENGMDWNLLSQTMVNFSGINYGGVAQDGNKETNEISTYAWGKYKDLTLENYGENSIPDVELSISSNRNGISSEQNQYYTTDEITANVTSGDSEALEKAELYVDGKLYQEDASAPFNVKIDGLEAGSHWVTAVAYDKDGAKNSASVSIGVSDLTAMPGWDAVSVGDSKMRGAFDFNSDGTVKIYGTGFGVADVANEEYPYAYTGMNGDFTASFKVEAQDVSEYDQVGFLLRDGLSAGDNSYVFYFQIYNGELFTKNSEKGKVYEKIGQQKYKNTPVWLRINKTGNKVTAEYSQDGAEWLKVGEEETDLSENYYFGLFGASAEDFKVSEFKLSDFRISNGTFSDLAGFEWAEPAIANLTQQGIVSGDGTGSYNPELNVTRAEFSKMLVGAYEAKNPNAVITEGEPSFADVDKSEWYSEYINKAYGYGLINGTTELTFEPDRNVTREEMAAMICRAVDGATAVYGDLTEEFSDADMISDWARPYVSALYALGIMQGDQNNCFNPLNYANRAEAAVVIYNFMSK